jgi:hypothetical protein
MGANRKTFVAITSTRATKRHPGLHLHLEPHFMAMLIQECPVHLEFSADPVVQTVAEVSGLRRQHSPGWEAGGFGIVGKPESVSI